MCLLKCLMHRGGTDRSGCDVPHTSDACLVSVLVNTHSTHDSSTTRTPHSNNFIGKKIRKWKRLDNTEICCIRKADAEFTKYIWKIKFENQRMNLNLGIKDGRYAIVRRAHDGACYKPHSQMDDTNWLHLTSFGFQRCSTATHIHRNATIPT